MESEEETSNLALSLNHLRIDRLDDNSKQLRMLEFKVLVLYLALSERE